MGLHRRLDSPAAICEAEAKLAAWVCTPNCSLCAAAFSILCRRNSCRICGCSVCSACLRENLITQVCTSCYGFVFPARSATHAGAEPNLSSLYDRFSRTKLAIEDKTLQLQTAGLSYDSACSLRDDVVGLFSRLEELRVALTATLSGESLRENFAHFCLGFYQQHKFTLQCIPEPPPAGDEGARQAQRVLREQRAFLKEQIQEAFAEGRLEDAVRLEESLQEIQCELGRRQ